MNFKKIILGLFIGFWLLENNSCCLECMIGSLKRSFDEKINCIKNYKFIDYKITYYLNKFHKNNGEALKNVTSSFEYSEDLNYKIDSLILNYQPYLKYNNFTNLNELITEFKFLKVINKKEILIILNNIHNNLKEKYIKKNLVYYLVIVYIVEKLNINRTSSRLMNELINTV